MKERPIIFSDTMVQAILAGRKTQTRRVPKEQPLPWATRFEPAPFEGYGKPGQWVQMTADANSQRGYLRCPYGVPGDRLWVRETWLDMGGGEPGAFHYRANATDPDVQWIQSEGYRWKSPIHMSRDHSRITLEIVGVRVERLQAISDAEIIAEGFLNDRISRFPVVWDEINAKRGYPWESNPWVWVIEFRRLEEK